ncbi:hypothetical protein, partial [Nocardia cyriacigeorgica]|uniref:hypothetical protein n=1 Tax=Nocardia cyriacigeorgica TaxID=135487 RepID=UPI00245439E5
FFYFFLFFSSFFLFFPFLFLLFGARAGFFWFIWAGPSRVFCGGPAVARERDRVLHGTTGG